MECFFDESRISGCKIPPACWMLAILSRMGARESLGNCEELFSRDEVVLLLAMSGGGLPQLLLLVTAGAAVGLLLVLRTIDREEVRCTSVCSCTTLGFRIGGPPRGTPCRAGGVSTEC